MKREDSPLVFVLKGLMPYSRANMMLAFNPSRFFNELERLSNHKRKTLQAAYYRAEKRGLVQDTCELSFDGWEKVLPFVAKKLQKDVVLMVIFDIPEDEASLRRAFRGYLKRLGFRQAQQSVWLSDNDYTEHTRRLVEHLGLSAYVQVYEAARIC